MSLFDQISSNLESRASSLLSNLTGGAAKSALVGAAVNKLAPAASSIARALQRGDTSALVGAGVNALRKKIGIASPLSNPLAADLYFQSSPNPLMGGITPQEAARLAAEARAANYSRKNLWFIEIGDGNPPKGYENIGRTFNMFATDVSFGPCTLASEGKQIGMVVMDAIMGTERTELRITTMDDANGSIRGWFKGKFDQMAHNDGTVGLPGDYLLTFRVVESAINDAAAASFGSHESTFVMRPTSLETELSRGEQAMQTIQLVFTQFDTFMFQGNK